MLLSDIYYCYFISRSSKNLTEEERRIASIIFLVFISLLLTWGLIILYRKHFIRQRIEKKMRYSESRDAFWNYDNIISVAKSSYIKAQLFLKQNNLKNLHFLSPHAKARLSHLKKKINSENDIVFRDAYIISFTDKKSYENDHATVFLDFQIKGNPRRFKELILLKRISPTEVVIEDFVKNPTTFMITHVRSFVER